MTRILCSAGEVSGDLLLARVLRTQRFEGVGLGGDVSVEAGLSTLAHARTVAAHGLVEAVGTIPAWLQAYRRLRAELGSVDGALLIDFPELNMRLLAQASRRGIPVAYLAPPQAWAWRPWRAKRLLEAAWVGCLLPFAAEWYRTQGVAAEWVGHPLADRPPLVYPKNPAVALLPGSRDSAVQTLLPVMLAAFRRIQKDAPNLKAYLAVAPTVDRMHIVRAVRAADLPVTLLYNSQAALAASTVALAGAGTATLECALAGRPVVTLAQLHPLTAVVARRLIKLPAVGLPNLILGRSVFPERVQSACSAVAVGQALYELLADPGRWNTALAELRARCYRPNFADRIAAQVSAVTQT